jgi:hypothetical protein
VEELLYPDKRPVAGWYLSMDDTAIVERQRAGTRYFKDTITDASIMLMRTRIGPDVPPAKKNLAVFLRYA